jgi:hypothetical protein
MTSPRLDNQLFMRDWGHLTWSVKACMGGQLGVSANISTTNTVIKN